MQKEATLRENRSPTSYLRYGLIWHGGQSQAPARGPRALATLTGFRQHGRQELAYDGAPLPHLALLAVGEVGDDADNIPGTRGLQCISHDQ